MVCWYERTCKKRNIICNDLKDCNSCTRYLQMKLQTEMANIPDEFPIVHKLDDTKKDQMAYMTLNSLDLQDFVVNGRSLVIESPNCGNGKAQPNFCEILTPTGSIKFGEVKIGDEILGTDGKTQKVVGVFPQGVRNYAKVTFNDKSSTYCDYEHIWRIEHNGREVDLTLREIINRWGTDLSKKRLVLPKLEPIEYSEKKFIIDPYVLGAFLGDGSMLRDSAKLSDKYGEVSTEVSHRLPNEYSLELGIAVGYYTKFIPEEYFYGSVQQRLDLLRGLMDTDGCCNRTKSRHRVHFSSVSRSLSEGVIRLARSLGIYASLYIGHRVKTYKGVSKEKISYIVHLNSTELNPFLIKRKAMKWEPSKQFTTRMFSKIEDCGETECTCIKVSNPDEMYLTNDYLPTHNTSWAKKLLLRYMAKKVGRINTGYFLNLPIAFAEVKEAITTKETLPYLKIFSTVRLLVIDEVGAKKLSEFEETWLLRMLSEREKTPGLATIYTLNSSPNLKEILGKRLYSRIYVKSQKVIFSEGDKRGWGKKK